MKEYDRRELDEAKHIEEKKEANQTDECQNPRVIFQSCDSCGGNIKREVPCNARFNDLCPKCAKEYRKKKRARYAMALDSYEFKYYPKMLTLTLRKVEGRITKRLKKIGDVFREVRRELNRVHDADIEMWLMAVEAPNHLHALIDMRYIEQDELSRIWNLKAEKVLDSGETVEEEYNPVVDIRGVDNEGRALNYVMKYLNKTTTKDFTRHGINIGAFENKNIVNSEGLLVILDDDKKYKPTCPLCGEETSFTPTPAWAFEDWKVWIKDTKPPPEAKKIISRSVILLDNN